MKKLTSVLLILTIVEVSNLYAVNQKIDEKALKEISKIIESETITVTAMQFFKDFAYNVLNAERKYNNKRVKIVGYVRTVQRSRYNNMLYVSLLATSYKDVNIFINDNDVNINEIINYKRGQYVEFTVFLFDIVNNVEYQYINLNIYSYM